MKIGIILLAAGSSSRLGQSKQLLPLDGKTLLRKSVETAYACMGENTVVVLGSQHEIHEKIINDLPLHIVINRHWQKGMGSSLKSGLMYFLEVIPDLSAVLVMVCDQPFVTKDHLDKIIQHYLSSQRKIIASSYPDTVGVPALFDKSLFEAIFNIDDQHGAKKIIEAHAELIETIDFPRGEIDIDTQNDYDMFWDLSRSPQSDQ